MQTSNNSSPRPIFVSIIRCSSQICSLFLPIILILLSINFQHTNYNNSPISAAQAAILGRHAAPATLQPDTIGNYSPENYSTPTVGQSPNTSSQFLILATGNQIKLYPLEAKPTNSEQTTAGNSHFSTPGKPFIVKPYEFNYEDAPKGSSLIETFGNSSIIRLFSERHLKLRDQRRRPTSYVNNGRRASILPAQDGHDFQLDNDELLGSKAGYTNPWIVDVDYFFSKSFCLPNLARSGTKNGSTSDRSSEIANDCLVILWLDKNNNLIRLGSVNLSQQPIDLPPTVSDLNMAKSASSRVLWLNEFSPIDILEAYRMQLSSADQLVDDKTLKIYGFAVSKPSHVSLEREIHIALGNGSNSRFNSILSIGIHLRQLDGTQEMLTVGQESAKSQLAILKTNHQHQELAAKAQLGPTAPSSLLINPATDRMYYFDPIEGGKISTFRTHQYQWPARVKTMFARDIPFRQQSEANNNNESDSRVRANTTAIAMDYDQKQLYWLNDDSSIYSSDLSSLKGQFIGKLKSKPAIRSVSSMQIFRNILFIGDSAKKFIIAYALPAGRDTSINGQVDSLTTTSIQPTQWTLLVDWPTVLGFRLFSYQVEYQPKCQLTEDVYAQLLYQPLTTSEKFEILFVFSSLLLINLLLIKLYLVIRKKQARIFGAPPLDDKVPV